MMTSNNNHYAHFRDITLNDLNFKKFLFYRPVFSKDVRAQAHFNINGKVQMKINSVCKMCFRMCLSKQKSTNQRSFLEDAEMWSECLGAHLLIKSL